jgi:hypothetical protein
MSKTGELWHAPSAKPSPVGRAPAEDRRERTQRCVSDGRRQATRPMGLITGLAHRIGRRMSVRSAVTAAGGIMLETSPPNEKISLTRLELM